MPLTSLALPPADGVRRASHRNAPPLPSALPDGLRFLNLASLPEIFDFPLDMARLPVEPNRLHTQALVRYYEREWNAINR